MSNTMEVANRLVSLCKEGRNKEAVNTLYSQNVVTIEPMSGPDMPARSEGLPAMQAKGEWWEKNMQVHSAEVRGPWLHGDRFTVYFKYDVTAKSGPMAGKRMTIEETGLYTVKEGKVTQAEFFYQPCQQ